MNEQISARPLKSRAGSFIQDLMPPLANLEPVKMTTEIQQLSYVEKLTTLTLQYLELSLPLPAALRAAEADL